MEWNEAPGRVVQTTCLGIITAKACMMQVSVLNNAYVRTNQATLVSLLDIGHVLDTSHSMPIRQMHSTSIITFPMVNKPADLQSMIN